MAREFPVLAAAVLAVACGGGGNPAGSSSSGVTGLVGGTITITSAGVSPRTITIRVGESVAFVNRDSIPHEIASNPHPEHTDCPPINELGTIGAGQTRTTGVFTAPRTCGFHDHIFDTNTALQGTIVIQ